MNKLCMMGLAVLCLCGCTHLKGVVVDAGSGRPVKTAAITVGRPGGIAVFEKHDVDKTGNFDFSISTIDENNVYVYDTAGDPAGAVHLDRSELSEKMHIRLMPTPRQDSPLRAQ